MNINGNMDRFGNINDRNLPMASVDQFGNIRSTISGCDLGRIDQFGNIINPLGRTPIGRIDRFGNVSIQNRLPWMR